MTDGLSREDTGRRALARTWSASACFCRIRWLASSSSCALRASCSAVRAASASAACGRSGAVGTLGHRVLSRGLGQPGCARWASERSAGGRTEASRISRSIATSRVKLPGGDKRRFDKSGDRPLSHERSAVPASALVAKEDAQRVQSTLRKPPVKVRRRRPHRWSPGGGAPCPLCGCAGSSQLLRTRAPQARGGGP